MDVINAWEWKSKAIFLKVQRDLKRQFTKEEGKSAHEKMLTISSH